MGGAVACKEVTEDLVTKAREAGFGAKEAIGFVTKEREERFHRTQTDPSMSEIKISTCKHRLKLFVLTYLPKKSRQES
eukprot:scaffold2482_cov166-Amphora_coffeaeformis.AAC.31